MLRNNQINAINITENNDFSSGIHNHTTGSGKSWIAMNIVDRFNEKYNDIIHFKPKIKCFENQSHYIEIHA